MKYVGTKEPLGFCIPGMCIFDVASDKVLKLDKHYGRSLNCDSVKDGKNNFDAATLLYSMTNFILNYSFFDFLALLLFFNSTKTVEKQLVMEVLRQLHTIRLWFEEQRHFLFFATSLLLVYDAELLRKDKSMLNVRIRMIDFAHVYPAHGSRDSNYLEGLCKLIQVIENLDSINTAIST